MPPAGALQASGMVSPSHPPSTQAEPSRTAPSTVCGSTADGIAGNGRLLLVLHLPGSDERLQAHDRVDDVLRGPMAGLSQIFLDFRCSSEPTRGGPNAGRPGRLPDQASVCTRTRWSSG